MGTLHGSDSSDVVVCSINKSEPPYQPNVYLCANDSVCCTVGGEAVCCYDNLNFDEMLWQAYPYALMFVGLQLVALAVSCYFSDNDDPLEAVEEQKEKNVVVNTLCPSYENDNVDDPLFGPLFEEAVPRNAYVEQAADIPESETLRRRRPTFIHED
ncbi:hypothetical protein Q1695_006917 [Nippostrongylus brasiliensis]|nr:hypothetical protein Q1695_006917 [Nippostrongylus brasiliensis]